MELSKIDNKIHECNLCGNMVEKFPNSQTVSIGKTSDIVILGEAPANNGWRKSGIAWHDTNNRLIPSGKRMQSLLAEIGYGLEDTYFLEAIKCYPLDRKYLRQCAEHCREFLFQQLDTIKPKIVFTLGDAATRILLDIDYKKFSEVAGQEFDAGGYKVIPLYHPSPINPYGYSTNLEIMKSLKYNKKVPELRRKI